MRNRFLVLIWLLNAITFVLNGQTVPVTFHYPEDRPGDIIFLAGSMNNWASADKDYFLTLNEELGSYIVTVNLAPGEYFYKYVKNGQWLIDPSNPDTDTAMVDNQPVVNSKITVSDPMITYLLPAFNESYTSQEPPSISAIVASATSSFNKDNFKVDINGKTAQNNIFINGLYKIMTYIPLASELTEGENTCKVSFIIGVNSISETINFHYSPDQGGGGGDGFSVSGSIKTAEKEPVSAVRIDYSVGPPVYTNANGDYFISGIKATQITLTPTRHDFTFTPTKIDLIMDKDYTGQDFIATQGGGGVGGSEQIQYTISGKVTVCGNPVEGIEIESRDKLVYTDADGKYLLTDTVEKNDMWHSPMSAVVYVNSDIYAFNSTSRQIDFTGATYDFADIDFSGVNFLDSISGIVSHINGSPFSNMPLKWEMIDENDNTVFYDSIIYSNTFGNYNAPFFYSDNSDGLFRYKYNITPLLDAYDYNIISVSASASCSNLKNRNITATYRPVPICMVSVSENNQNIVVWEKPVSDEILCFAVFREGDVADEYDYLDSIPYDSIATFIDTNSNPSVKAYRYKIATKLKYGYSVLNDNEHKTIHLTINKGTGSSWNLIWSHYEGISISTYKLYRGTDQNTMAFLTDIAGNLNSYTDLTPPTENVYYQIEMVLDNACNPEVTKLILKSARVENDYASTKSNIVSSVDAISSVNDIFIAKGIVYPNPVDNTLYIDELITNAQFEIYSSFGILINKGILKSSIDVSNLQSGLYHLRIKTTKGWTTYKFIK